jgi:hypothetical protein
MTKILVHDGKAHTDDFLGACVCLHKLPDSQLFRLHFVQESELKDPNCWVLDFGRDFDSDLHNFDHHQLEEEICSFTMVLDYFYGKSYRRIMPQLQFIEIFDSYGPKRAAEFAKINPDNLDIIFSPISNAILGLFSKISGQVSDPLLTIMKQIGKEICEQIENTELLLSVMDNSNYFERDKIKILDVTKCVLPQDIISQKEIRPDHLPTKLYSKINDIEPDIILTIDSRQNGFRMVSSNTDVIKFTHCDKAYFTHNSGFLVGFNNYEDYKFILDNFTIRHESKR